MKEMSFDVVVIGSGAGGGFAAMALAEAGLRVLVLERGRRYNPQKDFPMNYPDWEIRPQVFQETLTQDPTVAIKVGEDLDPGFTHLCSRPFGNVDPRPCTRRSPFRYRRAFGVGGSTLHYQGEAHRFPAHAFQPSKYGLGHDWPLDYEELAPYYQRVERILGVAGDPANPFKPPRGPFPTPPHRLSRASKHVAQAAAGLGWSLLPNSLALPTRSVDGRPPCQRSGGCVQGCIFGAKSSVDVTAIARGERTGRMTVRTNARALWLETDPSGRISQVIYKKDGERHRINATAFVLALGAIETPRLLLMSASGVYPQGIANGSGLIGHYLMETVSAVLTVRFNHRLDPYKGPPIDARIWDFNRPGPDSAARSGYVLGVSGTMGGYHGPVSYALRTGGIGLAHKKAMRERFGTVLSLFGIAEQEPRFNNHMTLTDAKDSDDMPKVHVISSYSTADRLVLGEMIERCQVLAEASGAVESLYLASSFNHPGGAHVAGTCRMGHDPEQSVVDPFGRCHETPNLFITDASVLVSQGAGDSPSLTIQALALRTADRINTLMGRYKL